MNNIRLLSLLFFSIILVSCSENFPPDLEEYYPQEDWDILSQELNLPENPYIYSSTAASGVVMGSPHLFDRRATIGRVLFYDKNLSADGSVSCASCHKQELAFSDDVSFSVGTHGNLTARNSFAIGSFRSLFNEYYSRRDITPGLFWDNRAQNPAEQIKQTMANPNEMGMELSEVVNQVQSIPYYQSLFKLASTPEDEFEINGENILESMQDFLRTVNSVNSKYDKELAKNSRFRSSEEPSGYTASEHNGKLLFHNHCSSCHGLSRSATGGRTANNGLDKVYKDAGLGSRDEYISNGSYDGLFKVPDLRNIALTAPYMHDGRFASLEVVVEHYSSGIKSHKNLSDNLRDESGEAKQFNFTSQEKRDLVSFLHTLTDHELVKEEKWSDPFKQ